MILAVKLIFLIGAVRLNAATFKPLVWAAVYAGAVTLMSAMFGNTLSGLIFYGMITFALVAVYFYLLNMFDDSWFYWPIFIAGGFIVLL